MATHLLLCALVGLHRKVEILHRLLDHRDGVRSLRLGVDALVGDDDGHLVERVARDHLPLPLADLQLALGQDLSAYVQGGGSGAGDLVSWWQGKWAGQWASTRTSGRAHPDLKDNVGLLEVAERLGQVLPLGH